MLLNFELSVLLEWSVLKLGINTPCLQSNFAMVWEAIFPTHVPVDFYFKGEKRRESFSVFRAKLIGRDFQIPPLQLRHSRDWGWVCAVGEVMANFTISYATTAVSRPTRGKYSSPKKEHGFALVWHMNYFKFHWSCANSTTKVIIRWLQ